MSVNGTSSIDNSSVSSPKCIEELQELDRSSFRDDVERLKAAAAARAFLSRVETPWETLNDLALGQPAVAACLKICKDLKLFEKWKGRAEEAMTVPELASLAGCDDTLLERVLRHLASHNFLHEVAPNTYKMTPFTESLAIPHYGAWIDYTFMTHVQVFHKLPEFVAQKGYENPTDSLQGAFQYAFNWRGHPFDYYQQHPEFAATFSEAMKGRLAERASWVDVYPSGNLLNGDEDQTGPLLVDVGGSIGNDIEKFRTAHPEHAARLVLQDRPEVVDKAICSPEVQVMAHDFFEPQPIKDARAYFMHFILHDWPDDQALKILANLHAAMKVGYSKLLLCENVVLPMDNNPQITSMDMTMMGMLSAQERTEQMWKELLQKASFKVTKIWTSPVSVDSIIEAEPV